MIKIGILLCLVAATVGSGHEEAVQEFSKGNQKFSADVLKVVFTDEHNKGIISPLSAQLVLALTADGAEGDTYDELKKALSLPSKEDTNEAVKDLLTILNKSSKDFNVSLADKLYIDEKFKVESSFKKVAVDSFKSEVQNVNFAQNKKTADLINKWVESKTDNRIKDLVSSDQINANTALVLVNALYVKGNWQTPFSPSKTSKKPFHYLSKKVEDVEMMHSTARYLYRRCGFLKAQFLEIPFKDSTTSVTFVLPDAVDGIVELHKHVELFLEPHKLTLQTVNVSLPKFSASTEHDLKEILSDLGAKKVFTNEADLSGISKTKDLFVNFIQQKAFIDINEAGVEAAAATAAGHGPLAIILPPPPEQTFNADHPFFYYIREAKSQVILFVGRYQ